MNRNRKTKKDVCKYCNNDFYHYTFDTQEFCSKECYYNSVRLLRPIVNCDVCNKEFQTRYGQKKRNDLNFCSRECYNNRKKENLKKLKRHTSFFMKLIEKGCECGIKEYYLLQIHHKDGDTSNNIPENLEVICANCHIRRHLKLNKKGKLVYHTKTLTSKDIEQLI